MKQILSIFLCAFAWTILADAQDIKRGWNIGPLPAVGYVSDLGLQYGALCDFYYYGDGSTFPAYMHKFNIQAAQYTKGSGIYHFFYDSKYLIPSLRVTFAASYLPDKMKGFYGFNGNSSPYDDQFKSGYYALDRRMTRIMGIVQKNFSDNLGWAAGLTFYKFNINRVKDKAYADETTLYDQYVSSGIIPADEAKGGSLFELKAGMVYDTRDHEAAPSNGMYAELMFFGSPDIIEKNDNAYLKLSAQISKFIPLADRLVLAGRATYQGTLAGTPPFYVQPTISTLYLRQINSEGLGGLNTIRGILLSRLAGDGYFWGNVELRWKMFNFRFLNQDWYAGLNPFFDFGQVVQPYRLDEMKASNDSSIYSGKSENMHFSAGVGLKLVMNRNFVISVEFARPFDSNDGKSGFYFGLNYIF